MRVRLEDRGQPDAVALRRFQVGLDPVSGVDHDRNAGVLVADEVRGASQVVVHELPEEHVATLAPDTAISLEVTGQRRAVSAPGRPGTVRASTTTSGDTMKRARAKWVGGGAAFVMLVAAGFAAAGILSGGAPAATAHDGASPSSLHLRIGLQRFQVSGKRLVAHGTAVALYRSGG